MLRIVQKPAAKASRCGSRTCSRPWNVGDEMAFVNYPNGNAVRMCLNCADALIRQGRGVRDEKKADPEGSAIDENTGNAAHRDEDSISELKSLRETLRDFIAHVNQVFDEFEERISALEAKPSPPATTNVTPLQRK